MSFFSDLFEGRWSNLGTDIVHAPSSLAAHPDELAETLGVVGLGVGGALGLGALGGEGLFGLGAADAAGAAGGTLAADLGIGDIGAAAAADAAGAGAFGTDALALAPAAVDPLAAMPGLDLSGGMGLGQAATDAAATGAADASTAAAPTFASTDAELTGGITGAAPAGTTGATAPAASSGGITGALNSALGSPYTKLALAGLPLATALAFGNPSLPSQLGPAQANAAALASQGSALNPSQQASLDQMRQNAINAARQALFNQGVQNPNADTRYGQMVANIDSQVTAAAQTMIQQNISNSLAGDQQLIQIAQLQMQSDQNFANMLVNATKALGTAAGLSSGVTLKLA